MDILDRIAADMTAFSPGLEKKLRAITASYKHVVRRITDDEFDELGGENDWFMFRGRQCVVRRRDNGTVAVWAL